MASSGFVPHDIHDHVKLADLLVIFECYLKKSTTVKKHSPSHFNDGMDANKPCGTLDER